MAHPPTPIEAENLRIFAGVLERHRDAVSDELTAAVRAMPEIAELLKGMDDATRKAQSEASWRRTRAALVDGDWGEYLASVQAEGRMYARRGVSLRTWYAVAAEYRRALLPRLLELPPMEAMAALQGENSFTEVGMAHLAQAYLDEKQAEVGVAEAEREMFAEVVRRSNLGIVLYEWMTPPDRATFRLTQSNPAAQRLVPEVLAGLGCREGDVGPADVELRGHLAEVLLQRATSDWTWTAADGNSAARTWKCHAFGVTERIASVVLQEITADLKMERLLQARMEQLERSNRELDAFAYVASHDLKAPLQDVRNLVEWIQEDVGEALPAPTRRHLDLLADRAARMERLLDDLLDYSRIGRVKEATARFVLRDAIDDVIAFLRPPAAFVIEVSGDSPEILTPRTPLEKVLRNLVANAVKHHDRGAGQIAVSATVEGPRVHISIGDDGPGIPPAYHDRAFQMFQTLRPKDEVEGSGVGLTIVKKTVEWFGGKVQLESNGRGTTVHFTWPLTLAEEHGGA